MTDLAPHPTELPDLSEPVRVDPAVVASFREKGHACIRSLAAPDELAAYTPAILAAAEASRRDFRPLEERETYGKAFLQMANLWTLDPVVRTFAFARRFASVAAQLLEVDAVRMYHDQALIKEPGGGITPWHQDQTFWPLDTDRTITMWMPLVDVPAEVGTMTFANGTNRMGHLGALGISDETEVSFAEMIAERGFELETHGALAAGDATFHTGWTLHSAPANPTPLVRSVMTIIWFADGVRVKKAESFFEKLDLKIWLDSAAPGELAAGPLNPVLHSSVD